MEIQGKVWGFTSTIFKKNNVQINRIEGVKGGYCSKHKHNHKFNMFFVEKGQLSVSVWKHDYKLVDVTVVGALQSTVVKPGEYHKFEVTGENTIAYEIYWIELDDEDIAREDHGGVLGQEDTP